MRLDKFLSNLKLGSRKEITKDIKKGLVKVDNVVIYDNGFKIDPKNNKVEYNNKLVTFRENINIAIYKPKGYLSANIDQMHQVVISLLPLQYQSYDFKIAGRLDLDSEGLLILTTNGNLVSQITNPRKQIEKTYVVETNLDIDNFESLLDGVIIKDGKNNNYLAKAIKITKFSSKKFEIVISEGKFHQVKRMFKYLGTEVTGLKRIQIGKLKLGDLKPGEYFEFKREDILWPIYYY